MLSDSLDYKVGIGSQFRIRLDDVMGCSNIILVENELSFFLHS